LKLKFPILKFLFSGLLFTGIGKLCAQHDNILTAKLDGQTKEITIQQEFLYKNSSNSTLDVLYFNDWANAYANKNTGLAKRFAEEFKKSLHLAKNDERGYTTIMSVVDDAYRGLKWERTKEEDILKIQLNSPLPPGESTKLFLTYTVQLPENKFTPYGYGKNNTYYLKDWYLTPAVLMIPGICIPIKTWKTYTQK